MRTEVLVGRSDGAGGRSRRSWRSCGGVSMRSLASRSGPGAGEGGRRCWRWVSGEQAGRQHGLEAAHEAGELGKGEIDQAVQLADAVVEILADAIAVPHQLAERLGGLVVQPDGGGPLLEGEVGETLGVDGVGFWCAPGRPPGRA
jgi:hypothetical protein